MCQGKRKLLLNVTSLTCGAPWICERHALCGNVAATLNVSQPRSAASPLRLNQIFGHFGVNSAATAAPTTTWYVCHAAQCNNLISASSLCAFADRRNTTDCASLREEKYPQNHPPIDAELATGETGVHRVLANKRTRRATRLPLTRDHFYMEKQND